MIKSENSNEVGIVVGSEETVLTFGYAHRNPPYYVSKGTVDEDDAIMTCYVTFNHHTEFPRRYVISFAEGLKAVREFIESGGLPTCIEWTEV